MEQGGPLTKQDLTEMTFEEAFRRLQEAVARLEAGDLPLEEALCVFERGVQLARWCGAYLNQAELRVRQLQVEDLEGQGSGPTLFDEPEPGIGGSGPKYY